MKCLSSTIFLQPYVLGLGLLFSASFSSAQISNGNDPDPASAERTFQIETSPFGESVKYNPTRHGFRLKHLRLKEPLVNNPLASLKANYLFGLGWSKFFSTQPGWNPFFDLPTRFTFQAPGPHLPEVGKLFLMFDSSGKEGGPKLVPLFWHSSFKASEPEIIAGVTYTKTTKFGRFFSLVTGEMVLIPLEVQNSKDYFSFYKPDLKKPTIRVVPTEKEIAPFFRFASTAESFRFDGLVNAESSAKTFYADFAAAPTETKQRVLATLAESFLAPFLQTPFEIKVGTIAENSDSNSRTQKNCFQLRTP